MTASHPERPEWGACGAEMCDKFVAIRVHQLCNAHYRLHLKQSKSLAESELVRHPDASTAFWSRVDVRGVDDCWPWRLAPHTHGHGTFNWNNATYPAYRVSVILSGRSTPRGLLVDHKCRNRICVNPGHLQVVTSKENAENISLRVDSPTGVRGVTMRSCGKFRARVGHHGVVIHVGDFASLGDAADAVKEARLKIHSNNLSDKE